MKSQIKEIFDIASDNYGTKEGKEANKKLVEEFPFLAIRNVWTGELEKDYDYEWIELDNLDEGWRRAFGLSLCIDLKEALIKEGILDEFYFVQIKEKYASLRLYTTPTPPNVQKVLNKYEDLSKYICGKCGNPATKITIGWYYPLCDDCIDEMGEYAKDSIPIQEFYDMKGKNSEECINKILQIC